MDNRRLGNGNNVAKGVPTVGRKPDAYCDINRRPPKHSENHPTPRGYCKKYGEASCQAAPSTLLPPHTTHARGFNGVKDW